MHTLWACVCVCFFFCFFFTPIMSAGKLTRMSRKSLTLDVERQVLWPIEAGERQVEVDHVLDLATSTIITIYYKLEWHSVERIPPPGWTVYLCIPLIGRIWIQTWNKIESVCCRHRTNLSTKFHPNPSTSVWNITRYNHSIWFITWRFSESQGYGRLLIFPDALMRAKQVGNCIFHALVTASGISSW